MRIRLKKRQEGGQIPNQMPQQGPPNIMAQLPPTLNEVQTEKGEKLIFPDGTITDVKANKKHHRMKDEEVTDVLPEGVYVASAFNKMKLNKADADNIVLDFVLDGYKEKSAGDLPQQTLLSELFKPSEKRVLPSVLTQRIQNKFKVIEPKEEQELDFFTERTNQTNKQARMPWLQGVVSLSEQKRQELEKEETMDELIEQLVMQSIQGQSQGLPVMRKGGFSGAPKKAQAGAIIQGVGAVVDIFSNIVAQNKANKLLNQNVRDINQTAADQQGLVNLGALAGFGSILAQDPTVRAPRLTTTLLDQIPTRIPLGLTDYAMSRQSAALRPLTDQAFAQSRNFGQAMNALSPAFAEMQNAFSSAGRQDFMDSLNRETAVLEAKSKLVNEQAAFDANAANATTANRNNQFGAMGSLATGTATSLANILGNRMANILSARGANFAATAQLQNQLGQSLFNAGSAYQLYQNPNFQVQQVPRWEDSPYSCPPGQTYNFATGQCE